MKLVDKSFILILSAIFLFSSIDKILHYEGFVKALRNYVLVPAGTAQYLAIPIIMLELLVGTGILLRVWRSRSALVAAALLASFSVAIYLNHLYGDRGICGCWFTVTLAKGTTAHLLQNITLFALALSVWWDARRKAAHRPALDSILSNDAASSARA